MLEIKVSDESPDLASLTESGAMCISLKHSRSVDWWSRVPVKVTAARLVLLKTGVLHTSTYSTSPGLEIFSADSRDRWGRGFIGSSSPNVLRFGDPGYSAWLNSLDSFNKPFAAADSLFLFQTTHDISCLCTFAKPFPFPGTLFCLIFIDLIMLPVECECHGKKGLSCLLQ